jgi:hypothetical protein
MTLIELNSKYIYVTDEERYGINEYWNELEYDGINFWGDCESYAITIKRYIKGFEDYNYYYCKLNGVGHCLLVSPDELYCIDNNVKRKIPLNLYESTYIVDGLRPYKWYELWWKFSTAYLISIFK